MASIDERIQRFFRSSAFGVVGASNNRSKFGNRVLRAYQEHGLKAVPVNPRERVIEGAACVASVSDLPLEVKSISVITPPQVTETVVKQAIERGIRSVWMQPGAESDAAVALCERAGLDVIADGSCVLVVLRNRGRDPGAVPGP
jgi:predicted CoA-binding protein